MKTLILAIGIFVLAGCGGGGNQSTTNPYASSFAGYYYASSQSDVYHYPSCPSVGQISSLNLISFNSANKAVTAQYRPCQICTPPLGVATNSPPVISVSSATPTLFNVADIGNTVRFTLRIYDDYGDANLVSSEIIAPNYTSYNKETIPLGLDAKGAEFTLNLSTSKDINRSLEGYHTINIYVTDFKSQRSNTVSIMVAVDNT